MDHAFAYGTLLFPQVRQLLLPQLTQEGKPATVKGYRRYESKTRAACNFPTIVAESDASVDGLLFEVDETDLEVLDYLEGVSCDFYTRERVTAHIGLDETVGCWAYVCSNGLREALIEPLGKTWHPLAFHRELEAYVKHVGAITSEEEFEKRFRVIG